MRLLHFVTLLLVLSYHVLSAPATGPQRKGRSFKVDRVRRTDYVAHGPTALRKAYRKFNIPTTMFGVDVDDFEPIDMKQAVLSSNSPDSEPQRTGSVSATSVQSKAEFVSPVTIGGQKIVMDFDTGSSDFWVMSTATPGAAGTGHTVFDTSKSPTFNLIEDAWFQIQYGDSSFVAGRVGTDTVNIGGVTVPNQAIGIPLEVSQSFIEDVASNGLVGLGFRSLNTVEPQKQATFFGNVAPTLDEPVLTANLKSDAVGEYEFGVIDHTKYQGKLVNVPVDSSNGFWEFPSTVFVVGNGPEQGIKTAPSAIADTGTTLMLVSPEVVNAYYAQVNGAVLANGAGGYIYPCATELPSLAVAVDNVKVVMPGAMMNFSKVGTNTTTGEELCFGCLQSNQGTATQVFGDAFLRRLFVVFDLRGPSLGLAIPS